MQMNQTDSQAAVKNKTIEQVTVLGQGVMGVDIALTFAIAGYEVTAVDLLRRNWKRPKKSRSQLYANGRRRPPRQREGSEFATTYQSINGLGCRHCQG